MQIILKDGNSMNYEIIKKEAFTVLEKVETHTVSGEQNLNTIPDFWDRSNRDGTIKTLLGRTSDRKLIFGICYGNSHANSENFDYGIAVECASETIAPKGYRVNEIPARTWIVFECTGAMPDAIQNLWHEICTEFFSVSDHQPTYELDIEVYPDGDMTSKNYKSYIGIPVVNE